MTVIDRNDNPVIKKQIRLVKENVLKGDSIGMPIEVEDEDQPQTKNVSAGVARGAEDTCGWLFKSFSDM